MAKTEGLDVEKLKSMMDEKEITVIDLARGAKCSRTAVYNWLTKGAEPRTDALARICGVMGCTADHLVRPLVAPME